MGAAVMSDRYEQAKKQSRVDYCFEVYRLGVNYSTGRSGHKINQLALLWQLCRFVLSGAASSEDEKEKEKEAECAEDEDSSAATSKEFRQALRVAHRAAGAFYATSRYIFIGLQSVVFLCFRGPDWEYISNIWSCDKGEKSGHDENPNDKHGASTEKTGQAKSNQDTGIQFLLNFKQYLEEIAIVPEYAGGNDQNGAAEKMESARMKRFDELRELLEATYTARERGNCSNDALKSEQELTASGAAEAAANSLNRGQRRRLLIPKVHPAMGQTKEMNEKMRAQCENELNESLKKGEHRAIMSGWLRKLNSGEPEVSALDASLIVNQDTPDFGSLSAWDD
jgi:hypothetical protein